MAAKMRFKLQNTRHTETFLVDLADLCTFHLHFTRVAVKHLMPVTEVSDTEILGKI